MKELVFSDRAKDDLGCLDRATRVRVLAAIRRLVLTSTGNIKKLQGIDPPEYRVRVGEWRIRFLTLTPTPFVSTVFRIAGKHTVRLVA